MLLQSKNNGYTVTKQIWHIMLICKAQNQYCLCSNCNDITGWIMLRCVNYIRLSLLGLIAVVVPLCVACYLFVWFWSVLDRAQGLTLVLQLVVELAEFSSSIAGLLVDAFTALVTGLLSCIETLALTHKRGYQRACCCSGFMCLIYVCVSDLFLFFFSATLWLVVLLIAPDQPVIEVRHQEGGVVSFSHRLSHLERIFLDKSDNCSATCVLWVTLVARAAVTCSCSRTNTCVPLLPTRLCWISLSRSFSTGISLLSTKNFW